jgi:hypothetical protein
MANMPMNFNDEDERRSKGPFSEPAVDTVPRGQGTRYAKKYVRIPAEVMKHQIMPAASNMAAQVMQTASIPRGQRFKVYHQLLSRFLELAIDKYRRENGLDQAQGEGVLEGVTFTGIGGPQEVKKLTEGKDTK